MGRSVLSLEMPRYLPRLTLQIGTESYTKELNMRESSFSSILSLTRKSSTWHMTAFALRLTWWSRLSLGLKLLLLIRKDSICWEWAKKEIQLVSSKKPQIPNRRKSLPPKFYIWISRGDWHQASSFQAALFQRLNSIILELRVGKLQPMDFKMPNTSLLRMQTRSSVHSWLCGLQQALPLKILAQRLTIRAQRMKA